MNDTFGSDTSASSDDSLDVGLDDHRPDFEKTHNINKNSLMEMIQSDDQEDDHVDENPDFEVVFGNLPPRLADGVKTYVLGIIYSKLNSFALVNPSNPNFALDFGTPVLLSTGDSIAGAVSVLLWKNKYKPSRQIRYGKFLGRSEITDIAF